MFYINTTRGQQNFKGMLRKLAGSVPLKIFHNIQMLRSHRKKTSLSCKDSLKAKATDVRWKCYYWPKQRWTEASQGGKATMRPKISSCQSGILGTCCLGSEPRLPWPQLWSKNQSPPPRREQLLGGGHWSWIGRLRRRAASCISMQTRRVGLSAQRAISLPCPTSQCLSQFNTRQHLFS